MKKSVIFILILIFPFISKSQDNTHIHDEKCGTEKITKILEEKYPEYRQERSKVNIQTENWLSEHLDMKKSNRLFSALYCIKSTNDQSC